MRCLRHLLVVLACLLPIVPCQAEDEKAGTACTYPALIASDDDGLHAIYEGIRLGLEKAALARVCLEELPDDAAGWTAFERKWKERTDEAHEDPAVVFGLGDRLVHALRARLPGIPKVFAVERLASQGKPALALPPINDGQALVVAQMDAERLTPVLRRITNRTSPRVLLPSGQIPARLLAGLQAFVKHAGGAVSSADAKPDLVLHLRRGKAPFAAALKQARALKIPLVSDDRARFGHGAIVVFCPDHRQVGRTAADLARRLLHGERVDQPVRTLRGVRVWVDLEAADRGGVELPLAFLATADRIRPGIRRRLDR